jgi:hypothetical protein
MTGDRIAEMLRAFATLLAEMEQVHTDHPSRHYDRTCPACNAAPSSGQLVEVIGEGATPRSDAIRNLIPEASIAKVEGIVSVPIEPDAEMVRAGLRIMASDGALASVSEIYEAMIAAAGRAG